MQKTVLAALAVATILTGAVVGNRAAAITPASPPVLGATADNAGLVQQAAHICGNNGCVPVQTKRIFKPKQQPAPLNRAFHPV
jgi:hypothetical protein